MSWQYNNSTKLPRIYTKKSFLYLVGIKNKDFIHLIERKDLHYKKDRKIKSDGLRFREIYKPDRSLKFLLKKISRRYLSKLNYPPFAHCGPLGRSILTACKGHNKFTYHISLDIDCFFDKVSKEVTENILIKVGVRKVVAKLITDIAVENNQLPQGFPTSSLLSTLVISFVLQDFYSNFEKSKILLSVYADDILISSDDEIIVAAAEEFITEKLKGVGLSLNSKKDIGKNGSRFRWLGLQIYPWVTIPRENLKKLQKEVYTHKILGIIPKDFKPKRKGILKNQWKQSVKGKIAFAQSINSNKLLKRISKDSQ
ncbi:MAG: Retron-type RNA-directed polymerase [Segetibacter sp.]|nr:Retron-type RNA-directed polymerase [Segetibacter sp.]